MLSWGNVTSIFWKNVNGLGDGLVLKPLTGSPQGRGPRLAPVETPNGRSPAPLARPSSEYPIDGPVRLRRPSAASQVRTRMPVFLTYRLLDGKDTVDACHIDAAAAFWDYSRASAQLIFGDRLGGVDADRLYAALVKARPAGLDRTAH